VEIKKIISPLQLWLLARGRCVGCSMPLSKGKREVKSGQERVICKCGRVFIFDKKSREYRRALFEEV